MSDLLFKVLIIGDATVGKTSFVQRYVHGVNRREYKPTIGGQYALGTAVITVTIKSLQTTCLKFTPFDDMKGVLKSAATFRWHPYQTDAPAISTSSISP